MNSSAPYKVDGEVALITLNNPPVNGLGLELRKAIAAGIATALADSAVKAIVLMGSERAFSGGADVREFATPLAFATPRLQTLVDTVENSSKPVIAAISGVCLGGGLELAMACHFRIATADASLGLPEVKLGLIPGAGGTQRLPRLVGLEMALNLALSGEPASAKQLTGTKLLDRIVAGDLLQSALTFAREIVGEKRAIQRTRDLVVSQLGADAVLAAARAKVTPTAKQYPAPLLCLEAIAAAVDRSFDEGMEIERKTFTTVMDTPQSRALRHAFFAERAASKIADMPADTPVRRIERVGVIGAGTMGSGIAMAFLNADLPVVILETKQEALDRGLGVIRKQYESSLKKGKLTQDKLNARLARLTPTLDYADLASCDLVVEAVFEDMTVKKQVFTTLDRIVKAGAILASNTSSLDLNEIARTTRRPQDVIGLHFFSPAQVMRLLEVVRGDQTSMEVLATAMQLAKRIKKVAVVARVCDGFIGNRMLHYYLLAAEELLDLGASPEQVDKTLEEFGFAMGPFRVSDLAGLDIARAMRRERVTANANVQSGMIDRLCEAGRLGQKTGAGWYRYEAGNREAHPDAAVSAMLDQHRREQAITPRSVSADEIVERCVYALVNEGARILEEGIAQRASDIDVVYLNGYGFPPFRGGPMHYADEVGLRNVVQALQRIATQSRTDASFWQPAELLARLAAENKTFADATK